LAGGKTVKKIAASDWSVGKTVKKIKNVFIVFPTDQLEAELLYFYSLLFSVKKPFQKTKIFCEISRL
jgi:hypothetical protein